MRQDSESLDPSREDVTVVDAVDGYLERDPTLADTVARGLARFRKTARQLIEENR